MRKRGGIDERLLTTISQTKKAATLDKPSADNYREYNNNILLCILINSYILGDLMKSNNKWTRYYLYKDGKKIDTCTKKEINDYWLKYHNIKWISKENRTLEIA